MPTLTTTSIYPKPRKRKAVLVPPKHDKANKPTVDAQFIKYQRAKYELFSTLSRDLDASYKANKSAEEYTLSDIEKAHDTFVAGGLMYRILMAKRG